MGLELSTWLAIGRSLQVLGSLSASVMHGYMTVQVHAFSVGVSIEMVVLMLLACILLGYSTLVITVQYIGQRTKKKSWLTAFVVCDVVACVALLVIINIFASAGLPLRCAGVSRQSLEGHCELERSYYAIAIALVFTYIFTITLTALRIFEQKYTKNTKVNEMLESLERAEDINLKVIDSPSPVDEAPPMNLTPPPSEGIITRNTSLRSNFTTATSIAASHHTGPYGPNPTPRRSIPTTIPRRPLPATSPTSNYSNSPSKTTHNPRPGPSAGFVPVPLDEDEDAAEAALVSDGMQHHPHRSHQTQFQPQNHPPYQPHRPHNHSHGHGHSHSHSHSRMTLPMLSEEDQLHSHSNSPTTDADHDADADAALVSDGMRPSEPMLPPYHPGNRRMSGHGGEEDNEMRLSGYVKGQTRAQGMKDSGRY